MRKINIFSGDSRPVRDGIKAKAEAAVARLEASFDSRAAYLVDRAIEESAGKLLGMSKDCHGKWGFDRDTLASLRKDWNERVKEVLDSVKVELTEEQREMVLAAYRDEVSAAIGEAVAREAETAVERAINQEARRLVTEWVQES